MIDRFLFRLCLVLFCFVDAVNVVHTQWVYVGPNVVDAGNVVTFKSNLFVGTRDAGVFRSTDEGATWNAVNNGLTNLHARALAGTDSNLFAGTYGKGIFRSTDSGDHWTSVNSGLIDTLIASLATGPNPLGGVNLYAGTYTNGIFMSSDEGESWNLLWSGIGCGSTIAPRGSHIFASNYDVSSFSSDYGASWSSSAPGATEDWEFTPALTGGFNVFASQSSGIFPGGGLRLSADSSRTWELTNLQSKNVTFLATSGTNLFASCAPGYADSAVGILLSTDNGASWTNVSAGLPDSGNNGSLSVSDRYLFRNSFLGGLWRRPLSEMITSVRTLTSELPERYELYQNYPNPFNPATTIKFQIPQTQYVTLKVYDALGRELSTLVSERLSVGTYSSIWDAVGMPSGVYFYSLSAGEFSSVKKLLLLR